MYAPVLQARQLSVALGGQEILHQIDLSFDGGKIYALCGANGCGKSTLLRALIGLLPPAQGMVLLQRQNIRNYTAKERARRMTLLAQMRQAAPQMTVSELVACGRFSHARRGSASAAANQAAVTQALAWMQLERLADQPVAELSGGQQQRAWLAMAVAQQAGILLLDEPTTYLDIHHQIEVLGMVRMLSRRHGLTVIWVLHDLNQAAAFSDEMILLKDGRVFCHDTPHQVMQADTLHTVFGLAMPRLAQAGTPVCLPDYAAYLARSGT